jgi:hypothetical protein
VPPVDVFVGALIRAELRTAFIVTGDLLRMMDEIRPMDAALQRALGTPGPRALEAAFEHPFAGDVVRYALTAEATALRRRLGTVWAG